MAALAPLPLGEKLLLLQQEFRTHLAHWASLEIERRRLFNWLPVAMGLGVLAYFAADREPGLAAPLIGLGFCAAVALLLRSRPVAHGVAVAIAFGFLGFAAGIWRTSQVAAPLLERPLFGTLSGHVESVERRAGGARLVIRPTALGELPAAKLPHRVRVTMRGGGIAAGDHVTGAARLLPPPEPARPGGYDFARDAFFRGIGGVGSFSGAPKLSSPPAPADRWLAFDAAIDRARNHLTERIVATIGGQAGAVAAALVTGKRGLISEETNEALRAAGIYHIVSISGLHMVLVAGAIFWLVRAGLALSISLVLVAPVKKIAALAAMIGATAYCLFSGSEVATERSLIMTLVMLGAILVDRPALSMRNLAIAALLVLAREPESLLGPSFQMSFGAVAAMIAWAERLRVREAAPPPLGLIGRMARIVKVAVIADIVTTLLATAATAPFGLYHFNTANPYGLIGNALALPFISLLVMPAAVAGALLWPFGLDGVAWWVMGQGTQPLLAFSGVIAGWGGATVKLPAFGPVALALLALALLWMTLWTTPLRWFAALPLVTGLALARAPDLPDGYIDRDGRGLMVRGADGRLAVLGKPSGFALAQWLGAQGDQRRPGDQSLGEGVACDTAGCVRDLGTRGAISHVTTLRAISEDCARAAIVVTPLPWRAPCAATLIDRQALDRLGAVTLTWRPDAAGTGRWQVTGARPAPTLPEAPSANATSGRPWIRPVRGPAIPNAQPNSQATAQTSPEATSPDPASSGADTDLRTD